MDKKSSLIEQSRFLEQLRPQATLYTCIHLAIDIWLGVHVVISDFCHCNELRCGLRNILVYFARLCEPNLFGLGLAFHHFPPPKLSQRCPRFTLNLCVLRYFLSFECATARGR